MPPYWPMIRGQSVELLFPFLLMPVALQFIFFYWDLPVLNFTVDFGPSSSFFLIVTLVITHVTIVHDLFLLQNVSC